MSNTFPTFPTKATTPWRSATAVAQQINPGLEEIANIAIFLASDESSTVLREELAADDGVSRFTTAF